MKRPATVLAVAPKGVTYEVTPAIRERKQVVVDRRLDELLAKHGGSVSTKDVLEDARDPESPLHPYFDWDDSVAAEKWRQQQALDMIMASKFVAVLTEEPAPPTVLHGDRPEVRRLVAAFTGEGFTMRPKALSDADMRAAIVARKKTVLKSWCREACDIEELREIREVIEKLI